MEKRFIRSLLLNLYSYRYGTHMNTTHVAASRLRTLGSGPENLLVKVVLDVKYFAWWKITLNFPGSRGSGLINVKWTDIVLSSIIRITSWIPLSWRELYGSARKQKRQKGHVPQGPAFEWAQKLTQETAIQVDFPNIWTKMSFFQGYFSKSS